MALNCCPHYVPRKAEFAQVKLFPILGKHLKHVCKMACTVVLTAKMMQASQGGQSEWWLFGPQGQIKSIIRLRLLLVGDEIVVEHNTKLEN
jgi:hypothetical protein